MSIPLLAALPLLSAIVLGCVAPSSTAHAALVEICDNCVDDDVDDLVDRADTADCRPLANGGGAGIGDPARGKALFKCHKALEKAGLAFSNKRLKRAYACVLPGFACIQTKPGDQECLAKANAKCDKQAPGAIADQQKVVTLISKACDPALVSDADLDADTGLGFLQEELVCDDETSPTGETIGGLAACIAAQHACHANRTLSAGIPRAREILLAMGRNPDTELPCLESPVGSDGGGVGLGDLGKAAVKCQKGITKGSLKLGSTIAKTLQKCVDLGVACLQQKNADPACLDKARAKCAKLSDKVQNQQSGTLLKILNGAAKTCAGLTTTQIKQATGLGFGAQADRCSDLGATQFGALGTIACAGVQGFCEGKQALIREVPRLDELLLLLNVQIIGL